MEIPDHLTCVLRNLYARQEAIVRTRHVLIRTMDCSKLGKEYIKAVYCHPAYLTFLQSTSEYNHRKLTKLITWIIALSNSMKLWAMLCRATQDGWVMVESSDNTWSTGEGNGKPLRYSCLEKPMNNMKKQKDMMLKDELPGSVDAQYATGEEWRNNSRLNEESEPKWK